RLLRGAVRVAGAGPAAHRPAGGLGRRLDRRLGGLVPDPPLTGPAGSAPLTVHPGALPARLTARRRSPDRCRGHVRPPRSPRAARRRDPRRAGRSARRSADPRCTSGPAPPASSGGTRSGGGARPGARRRRGPPARAPGGEGVGERGLALVALLPDLLPPGGAPLPGAGGGLRPGVGPAPAPPGLLLVGGVPVGAEDAGLLLGAQADVRVVLAHGRPLDHLVDG